MHTILPLPPVAGITMVKVAYVLGMDSNLQGHEEE